VRARRSRQGPVVEEAVGIEQLLGIEDILYFPLEFEQYRIREREVRTLLVESNSVFAGNLTTKSETEVEEFVHECGAPFFVVLEDGKVHVAVADVPATEYEGTMTLGHALSFF
jgi:hypothetical protein